MYTSNRRNNAGCGNISKTSKGNFNSNAESLQNYTAVMRRVTRSLTSSCSKTAYPITSPAPYTAAVSITATPSPSASPALDPGCVTLYTIQAGDTCDSITVSQNVQETDTYDSIIAAAHISVSPITFVAWNPNISPVCTNLLSLVGYHSCLRSVIISCLADSNPASKPRLTAFSNRPTGLANPNITIPNATALATVTGWPTVVPTVTPQLPIAPGTQTGCTNYVNYRDTTVYDSLYQPQSPLNTYTANLCSYVAASNDITVDYLLA
ncbi:hypothetical protein QBC46DRAFT_409349 [Diplogelasinospora grovesii]|uniref:LysM domain-containing protein n=1 Tax=Diplogelasinospora grovesii TaxID=303347 RepID=A0AAN6N5A0_9PEZI|nr:hypothetical protein QBC46DRAFT_409349 [Diplogelasinospora grovesii]